MVKEWGRIFDMELSFCELCVCGKRERQREKVTEKTKQLLHEPHDTALHEQKKTLKENLSETN